LKSVLDDLQKIYSNFLSTTYPDLTFEMASTLTSNGYMNLPVDVYRRSEKATVSARTTDIVIQYANLESSKKLMCIRIGYGWMHQKEEDSILTSFRLELSATSWLLEGSCLLVESLPNLPGIPWTLLPEALSSSHIFLSRVRGLPLVENCRCRLLLAYLLPLLVNQGRRSAVRHR
jgi:hypothetical protein